MAIIEFENVRFSYDGKRNALDGITLSIEAGSFVCILGGNGSGKSTFAKHINALLTPDEGRVSVLGLDTSAPENVFFVRSNAGMVFQNPDDQIVASVIENDVIVGFKPVIPTIRCDVCMKLGKLSVFVSGDILTQAKGIVAPAEIQIMALPFAGRVLTYSG